MEGRYNTRSPAVKRLMKEAQELREPTDQYFAQPLEDNLFEWHFTIRGPADSDFQNGVYHGRIILPVDYPMKPPSIIWLTPNGRFETNKKICLSISGHHPESWQPSWSIRTALLAIIGFMPTQPGGAIGSLDYKPEERKLLAKKTRDWRCPACGDVNNVLMERTSASSNQEAKDLAAQINFQGEKPKVKEEKPVEAAAKATQSNNSTSTDATANAGTGNVASVSAPSITQQQPSPEQDRLGPLPPPPFAPWLSPPHTARHCVFPQYPWSSAPMMTSGQRGESRVSAMVPRFPYPPSHYSGYSSFYPPGFGLPSGVGMFPCRMPPMPNPMAAMSVNNSSYPANFQSGSSRFPPRSQPQTFSSTSAPIRTLETQSASPASTQQSQAAKDDVIPQTDPQKDNVMKELLTKVKRVGSDTKENVQSTTETAAAASVVEGMTENEAAKTAGSSDMKEEIQASKAESTVKGLKDDKMELNEGKSSQNVSVASRAALVVGDSTDVRDVYEDKRRGGHSDSEVSVSLMKKDSQNDQPTGADVSHSDLLPDDQATDNSLAGALPLDGTETDQQPSRSSHLDKSISSSVPDLEKNKQKSGNGKNLRQRQSALANVPTEVNDDLEEPQPPSAGGQRIEAASGDTTTRLLHQRTTQAFAHGRDRQQRDPLLQTHNRRDTFDTSFIIMVLLSLATVFLLLNRLVKTVDMSDYIQFD